MPHLTLSYRTVFANFTFKLNLRATPNSLLVEWGKTVDGRPGCAKVEESRIRIKACLVSKKVSKLHTHYKKAQVRKRSTKLNIYLDELTRVSELNQQVSAKLR